MLHFVFYTSMKMVQIVSVPVNVVTHNRIQSLAGKATWIQEYIPIGSGNRIAIECLLKELYMLPRGGAAGWDTELWKVAGSIPNGLIGIFHWLLSSGRTMALGPTWPLTEMSTRNISLGIRQLVSRADNLIIFMCQLSRNLGTSTYLNAVGL